MCQALSISPNLKYQADGGPDNQAIMKLLKGSDTQERDQLAYLKAQMIFWLLGATDGHAKNFSVFLMPGQRFRMTPLYDVLSAQPSVAANQVSEKKYKLAMSVGKNNHYQINEIQPRHFLQTAERSNYGGRRIADELTQLRETAARTVEQALHTHHKSVPAELGDALLKGVEQRLRSIARRQESDA